MMLIDTKSWWKYGVQHLSGCVFFTQFCPESVDFKVCSLDFSTEMSMESLEQADAVGFGRSRNQLSLAHRDSDCKRQWFMRAGPDSAEHGVPGLSKEGKGVDYVYHFPVIPCFLYRGRGDMVWFGGRCTAGTGHQLPDWKRTQETGTGDESDLKLQRAAESDERIL